MPSFAPRLLVIFTMVVVQCGCTKVPQEHPSPDGVFFFRIVGQPGEVQLVVSDPKSSSQVIYTNRHLFGFDVRWRGSALQVEDDAGIWIFEFRRGKWVKRDPLRTVSPDRRLCAYVFWNGTGKTAALFLLEGPNIDGTYSRVAQEVDLFGVVVSDLVDAVTWKETNTLVLRSDSGSVLVRQDADGIWRVQ